MLRKVHEILGRKMTFAEFQIYLDIRKHGVNNAYDIVDLMKEW